MFEKIKLNSFKKKITKVSNIDILKQLYLSAPDYIKNNQEICEIYFNKNNKLFNLLPIQFQLEKLHNQNIESLLPLSSAITQKEFLKNHVSDDIINIYISNFTEIITDYIINNVSIFNKVDISLTTKKNILYMLKSNNSLNIIIKSSELLNNIELINYCIDLDNNLLTKISSKLRIDYFLSKVSPIMNNQEYLNYYKYLIPQEKFEIFNKILLIKGSNISKEEIKTLINNMPIELQKKIVLSNLELLKYCSKEVQLDIITNYTDLIKYLDNKVIKEVLNNNPNLVYQLKEIKTSYLNSFEHLNDINVKNIKLNDVIKNPIYNAKGTMLRIASANGDYDMLYGINQYSKSQYDFFQRMSDEQIARLCMIDVNYIMPLVNVKKDNIEHAKLRIKNIFKLMYGEEILKKYSLLIDNIINNYNFDCQNNPDCILDSLKIIFNKDIIKNNNINSINEYITSNINNIPNRELFVTLIKNAYGNSASEILLSRNKLNEHNINSLEILAPSIVEKFGVGLIHDLISYNISNMSYFLMLAKDNNKMSNLYNLYEMESNIYGKNISTFQRTLNDFEKMENLLIDIGDNNLSDNELENLYSLIINRNFGDITKKEELINYEKIVKSKLLQILGEVNDINYIKNIICNALFGINFNENVERNDKNASYYLNLYNNSNAYNNDLLNVNEKIILDILDIIINENNKENVMDFITKLFEEESILGNIDFINAIKKIKSNQEKLLNDNLVNVEKLENEIKNGSNKVLKINKSGVPIYILNGLDFGILQHNIGGTNNDYIKNINGNPLSSLESFEEQYNSSTISMWYYSNNNDFVEQQRDILDASLGIGYYNIPEDSIVGMDTGSIARDISTDHASKLTTSFANGGSIDFNAVNKSTKSEEISIYRKIRDQQLITNDNKGGRFDFDYFAGTIYLSDLNNINNLNLFGKGFELFTEAKQRNKPIILINKYAYLKNKSNLQEEKIERGISK